MKRGEIWSVSGGSRYTGKPRPAVIVQDNNFAQTSSVTLCAFTTDATDAPLLRLAIEPSSTNNLKSPCRIMVDKIATVPKSRLGKKIGQLGTADMQRLNQALLLFMGLATPVRRGR